MRITIYGSLFCQDTIYALMKVKEKGISVNMQNISTDFKALREFMKIRENDPIFDEVKANDRTGIPLFIMEDGSKSLDLNEVLKKI